MSAVIVPVRKSLSAPPVMVAMSGTLVAVLLRNLFDNALRYGPEGGRVAVQVAPPQAHQGARLVVEDAGQPRHLPIVIEASCSARLTRPFRYPQLSQILAKLQQTAVREVHNTQLNRHSELFRSLIGNSRTAFTGDEEVHFAKLRSGGHNSQSGVFDRSVVVFDPNKSFHKGYP